MAGKMPGYNPSPYRGKYSGSGGRNYGSSRLPLNIGGGGGGGGSGGSGGSGSGCKKSFAAGAGVLVLLLLVGGANVVYVSRAILWALS